MPTLVRVRGKPGNLRAIRRKAEIREQAQGLQFVDSQTPKAKLNGLPTELIQDIFCYGTNLPLPLVSSRLYAQLSGEAVRMRLVYRVFQGSEQEKSTDTERPRNIQADLQSDLLRQRWLDHKFMRKCQWLHIERVIHYEAALFARSVGAPDIDMNKIRRDVTNMIKDRFVMRDQCIGRATNATESIEINNSTLHFNLGERSINLLVEGACTENPDDERIKDEWTNDERMNDYDSDELQAAGINWKHTYNFPAISTDCELPSRLLHGPWTKGKGLLLATVRMSMGFTEYETDSLAAVKNGMRDAIHEKCVLALKLLTQSNSMRSSDHHQCPTPRRESPWDDPELDQPWKASCTLSQTISWSNLGLSIEDIETFLRSEPNDADTEIAQLLINMSSSQHIVEVDELIRLLLRLQAEYEDDLPRLTRIRDVREKVRIIYGR